MINVSKSGTQPISLNQVSVAGTSTAPSNTTDAAGNVGWEIDLGNNENINSYDEGIELCGGSYSNSVSEDASFTCREENDSLNLNDPDQLHHNNEIVLSNTTSKNVMSLVSSTPQRSKRCLDCNASTVKEKKLRGSHSENQMIFSKLNQIMLTQKNHTILINKLIAHSGMSAPATPRPDGWPIKLPLPDDQAFFAWENFLVADTNFDYAVEYFVNSSSNKIFEDTTREILKSLISKQLKKKLNWKGTEKKFGLKQRRTGDVIIEAVRRRHKDAIKKKIITTISVWLRNNLTKDKDPEDGEDGSSSDGGGGGQSGNDSDASQSMAESD